MGASLRYAKVIDLERFQHQGGQVRPSLPSTVGLSSSEPGLAKPFVVLRAWDDFDAMTESWSIRDPHGRTIYGPVTREVRAEDAELTDEVIDAGIDYDAEGYQLVLEVDGGEVARADFTVEPPDRPQAAG